MLAGHPPFVAGSVPAVLARHVEDEVPRVRRLRPEVPLHVEQAVQKALAKAPESRFPGVADFAAALGRSSSILRPAGSGRWLLLGALVALAAAIAVLFGRRAGGRAAALDSAVAILPFSVNGPDSMNLGPGMVGLLGTKFDGAGDPAQRRRPGPAGLPAGRRAPALRPGRGRTGGPPLFRPATTCLAMCSTSPDACASSRRSTKSGASSRSPPLRARATRRSSSRSWTRWWAGCSRHAARRSRCRASRPTPRHLLPALKAFLEGEQALRIGDFDGAAADYGRAVQGDSTFALAWYRLSEAGEYLLREDLATDAAAAAERWSARLPERERTLLAARLAARQGRIDTALELLAGAARTHPDDVEAWTQLAEIRFHNGPWRGEPISLSRDPWQRAAALDPGLAAPPLHLGRIASIEGKRAVLDSLLGVLHSVTRRPPGGTREQYLEERVLRAFVFGDTTEQAARLDELRGAAEVTQALSLWSVAVFGGEVEAALRIAHALADSSHTQRVRVSATGDAVWLHAAEGRWGRPPTRSNGCAGSTACSPWNSARSSTCCRSGKCRRSAANAGMRSS
jgi:tetratricopeptide (TPR) repeat protein